MKSIINKALYRFGYRITEVPHFEYELPNYIYNNQIAESLEQALETADKAVIHVNNNTEWETKHDHDNYLTPKRIAFYNCIIKKCMEYDIDFNDKSVADIGCASGYLLRAIDILYNPTSLYGYEHNPVEIEKAKIICPNGYFKRSDILKQNIEESFDIIFITEVLEHLRDPELVVEYAYSLLNKGGMLILTVPDGRYDRLDMGRSVDNGKIYIGHINFWSPESWEIFLNKAGIEFSKIFTDKVENIPNHGNIAILYK